MSITRKCLDRKNFISKLEQVKYDPQGELLKASLGQTVNRGDSANNRKSKQKTIKIVPNRSDSVRDPTAFKNQRTSKLHLDRSKESKQSRDSLLKSTQSYYVAKRKAKRGGSAAEKQTKGNKSRDLNNTSNFVNSTFEMQSFVSSHKKKQSNFSSTIGSKFDVAQLNRSGEERDPVGELDRLGHLLLKSETVLERYRAKYEALERESKRYKRKYQQAVRKIKHLQSRN